VQDAIQTAIYSMLGARVRWAHVVGEKDEDWSWGGGLVELGISTVPYPYILRVFRAIRYGYSWSRNRTVNRIYGRKMASARVEDVAHS
jgi:hypothetical protein